LFRALLHFLILAAAVFAIAAAPAFAQLYKWVDERGVTHYGERPPRGAKASEVQDKLASPPPQRAAPRPSEKDEPRAAEPGTPPTNPNAPATPQGPAAKAPTPQEQQAEARRAACARERAALVRLKGAPNSYVIDEKGEKTLVDNSAAIAEQEKRVGEQCRN
jgi:hypothetical protein